MKVSHPWAALGIFFGFGIILHMYGLHDGSFYVFDVVGAIAFYRFCFRY